jgi:hypothetical protein
MAQAVQPGAQQGRGLHVGGKHALRAAHKGGDAQPGGPVAHRLRAKSLQQGAQRIGALGIAGGERVQRFGVGEVHATFAGQQKLAADRGHGVEQVDRQTGV